MSAKHLPIVLAIVLVVGLAAYVGCNVYAAWEYRANHAINYSEHWIVVANPNPPPLWEYICQIGNCTEAQEQMLIDGNASYLIVDGHQ